MNGNVLAFVISFKAIAVQGSVMEIVLTHSNSSPSLVINFIVT